MRWASVDWSINVSCYKRKNVPANALWNSTWWSVLYEIRGDCGGWNSTAWFLNLHFMSYLHHAQRCIWAKYSVTREVSSMLQNIKKNLKDTFIFELESVPDRTRDIWHQQYEPCSYHTVNNLARLKTIAHALRIDKTRCINTFSDKRRKNTFS